MKILCPAAILLIIPNEYEENIHEFMHKKINISNWKLSGKPSFNEYLVLEPLFFIDWCLYIQVWALKLLGLLSDSQKAVM